MADDSANIVPAKRLKLDETESELDAESSIAHQKDISDKKESLSPLVLISDTGQPGVSNTGKEVADSNTNGNYPSTSSLTSKDADDDEKAMDDGSSSSSGSDVSEMSGLSELSGEEAWKARSGSLQWVYSCMSDGVDPRAILKQILPVETVLPENIDSLTLWKIIVNLMSEPPPRKKLDNYNTLDDVVQLMKTCSNIVVLTGAGVSVSCGIPDFRSKNGIYSRLAVDFPDLPNPQAMFDIHYFRNEQRPFFKFAKEIYPGQFEPSKCHKFIRLIEQHGKLLRNYTQNIDTLEQVAGIKNVIQCHGSFATATCMACKHKCSSDDVKDDIMKQVIPRCPKCPPDTEQSVMKPDIVFFGESLPEEFHDQMAIDKDKCDLLIVIGSSLKVRPVALIPNSLPPEVPQILINKEHLRNLNFDVELLGDCDTIIGELCHRLGDGWTELAAREPMTEISRDELPTPPMSHDGEGEEGNEAMAKGGSGDGDNGDCGKVDGKSDNRDSDNGKNSENQTNNASINEISSGDGDNGDCGKVDGKSDNRDSDNGKNSENQTNNASINEISSSRDNHGSIDTKPHTSDQKTTSSNTCRESENKTDASKLSENLDNVVPTPSIEPSVSDIVDKDSVVDSTKEGESLGRKENAVGEPEVGTSRSGSQCSLPPEVESSWWQPKKFNVASRLQENQFCFVPPHRYVFPHAEFYIRVGEDGDDEIMRNDLDRTRTTESSLSGSHVADMNSDDGGADDDDMSGSDGDGRLADGADDDGDIGDGAADGNGGTDGNDMAGGVDDDKKHRDDHAEVEITEADSSEMVDSDVGGKENENSTRDSEVSN